MAKVHLSLISYYRAAGDGT